MVSGSSVHKRRIEQRRGRTTEGKGKVKETERKEEETHGSE